MAERREVVGPRVSTSAGDPWKVVSEYMMCMLYVYIICLD